MGDTSKRTMLEREEHLPLIHGTKKMDEKDVYREKEDLVQAANFFTSYICWNRNCSWNKLVEEVEHVV